MGWVFDLAFRTLEPIRDQHIDPIGMHLLKLSQLRSSEGQSLEPNLILAKCLIARTHISSCIYQTFQLEPVLYLCGRWVSDSLLPFCL